MKNYAIVVSILLVVAIVILAVQKSVNNVPAILDQGTLVSSSSTPTTASSAVLTPKAAVKQTVISGSVVSNVTVNAETGLNTPVVQGNLSYQDYMNKLGAATQKCDKVASTMYDQKYANVYSGESRTISFNSVSGWCYMRVIGATQKAYTASTTGVIFFIDVYRNRVLADCTTSTGLSYTYSDWSCTDRVTGQTIPRQQFEDTVYKYLTK